MNMQTLALGFLAATTVGGIAYVFLYPSLSGEKKAEARRSSVARSEPAARHVDKTQRSRREQVEGTLKEVEARQRKVKKVALAVRITQAGLDWTNKKFIVVSALLGLLGLLLPYILNGQLLGLIAHKPEQQLQGRTITDTKTAVLANGAAIWLLTAEKNANAALTIVDGVGQLAFNGSVSLSAGIGQPFTWRGFNSDGKQWPPGKYDLKVEGTDPSGNVVPVKTQVLVEAGPAVAPNGLGGALLAAIGLAFACGIGIPRWMLNYLKKRREKKFLKALPDAVDVIVRGIKAGLPLFDSIKVVAADAPEPLRSEFNAIIETQAIGMPLVEACARLFERMPLPEANFFGIVIAIQQKSGGNLSEALGNLSKVLRDRKRMAEKIQAMSMEAKASAGIIGSLPPIVMLLVYLSTPDYISLLWTHPTGQLMLVGCAVWMTCGILVMKKMINFDF
ncbi:MAG: type secretion system protein [Tardiphaga sp.]|nr:type secretion system protein [Tardiphaga sp.]